MAGIMLRGNGGGLVVTARGNSDTAQAAAPLVGTQSSPAAACRSHGTGSFSSSSSSSASSSPLRHLNTRILDSAAHSGGARSGSSSVVVGGSKTQSQEEQGSGGEHPSALPSTSTPSSSAASSHSHSQASSSSSSTSETRVRLQGADHHHHHHQAPKASAASPRRSKKNCAQNGQSCGPSISASAGAASEVGNPHTAPPSKAAAAASSGGPHAKDALLNGHSSSSSSSTPTSSPPAEASSAGESCPPHHPPQDGEGASRVLRPTELLLLPKVGDLLLLQENDVSGTSSPHSTFSSLQALPPVPSDMAEAIKRQQKGASGVRYWKAKHLQSGRNHHHHNSNSSNSLPASLAASKAGGLHSSMFPVLKPPALHLSANNGLVTNGGGGGLSTMGPAGPRHSKAKERLMRQRAGRDNYGLGEFRRSINILGNGSSSSTSSGSGYSSGGGAPAYHTHYMYGHALGDYPPPPPAYRRSVTALASLLSLPLAPSPSSYSTSTFSSTSTSTHNASPPPPSSHPPSSYRLTQPFALTNPNPSHHPLTQVTHHPQPNPSALALITQNGAAEEEEAGGEGKSSLTQRDAKEEDTKAKKGQRGVLFQTAPGKDPQEEKENEEEERVTPRKEHHHRHPPHHQPPPQPLVGAKGAEAGEVAELTCLQLADAIISAKVADLSHYYQICQTKIRYVDFLERSASFRAMESAPTPSSSTSNRHSANKANPSSALLHPSHHQHHHHLNTPRLHTWVPGVDLREASGDDDPRGEDDLTGISPRHVSGTGGGVGGGVGVVGSGEGKESRSSALALPSLPASSSSSAGLKMVHGIAPPSSSSSASVGKGFLSSPRLGDPTTEGSILATSNPSTTTGLVIPSMAMPSGKPILKPFNPDAIPVKVHRAYDPFSPRSVYSDLTGTSSDTPAYPGVGLSVRGTTMYPLTTGEDTAGSRLAGEARRRSHSSKSRKDAAEMRKRAVRFSISDQVHEFAPGEPLVP